jgi:hypothetical protein
MLLPILFLRLVIAIRGSDPQIPAALIMRWPEVYRI